MIAPAPEFLTPREREVMQHESEQADKEMAYAIRIKELELESQKLEVKLSSLMKIPTTIIKLPVLILFGIGFIVNCFKKIEPSENFWKLLK